VIVLIAAVLVEINSNEAPQHRSSQAQGVVVLLDAWSESPTAPPPSDHAAPSAEVGSRPLFERALRREVSMALRESSFRVLDAHFANKSIFQRSTDNLLI
jgi:hypothetical protein